jgi:hypothetical protein
MARLRRIKFADEIITKYYHDVNLYYDVIDYQKKFGHPNVDKFDYKPDVYSTKTSKLNMCPFSKVVYNFIPALGQRVPIVVPCGKCKFCLHRKQNQLIYRVWNHSKNYCNSLFVTLTYNDDCLPEHDSMCRRDIQLFFKRLRKRLGKDNKFTYLCTCERGRKSGRLHFHLLIFWNCDVSVTQFKKYISGAWKFPKRNYTDFKTLFKTLEDNPNTNPLTNPIPAGFIYFGSVTGKSIAYCTKYSCKDIGSNCVFISWSNFMGYDILATDDLLREKLRCANTVTYYISPNQSYTVPVPRYYKQKLLTEIERGVLTKEWFNSQIFRDKLRAVRNDEVMFHYYELYQKYKENSKNRENVLDYKREKQNMLL